MELAWILHVIIAFIGIARLKKINSVIISPNMLHLGASVCQTLGDESEFTYFYINDLSGLAASNLDLKIVITASIADNVAQQPAKRQLVTGRHDFIKRMARDVVQIHRKTCLMNLLNISGDGHNIPCFFLPSLEIMLPYNLASPLLLDCDCMFDINTINCLFP
ncbi:hypothetical protein ACJX0J_038366 [Zea mays]